MANNRHLQLVQAGPHALREWRSRNSAVSLDLNGAHLLPEVNLSEADLSRAELSRADLSRYDLSGADLSRADLS